MSLSQLNIYDKWGRRDRVRVYFKYFVNTLAPTFPWLERSDLGYQNLVAWDEYIDLKTAQLTPILQDKAQIQTDIYGVQVLVDQRRYAADASTAQLITNQIQLVVGVNELLKGTSSQDFPLEDDDPWVYPTGLLAGYPVGATGYLDTTTWDKHENALHLFRLYDIMSAALHFEIIVANTRSNKCYRGIISSLSPVFHVGYPFMTDRTAEITVHVTSEGWIQSNANTPTGVAYDPVSYLYGDPSTTFDWETNR